MRVVAEPRAVDVSSNHQFEKEIGAASSENGLFIAKMEFSVQTGQISSRRLMAAASSGSSAKGARIAKST